MTSQRAGMASRRRAMKATRGPRRMTATASTSPGVSSSTRTRRTLAAVTGGRRPAAPEPRPRPRGWGGRPARAGWPPAARPRSRRSPARSRGPRGLGWAGYGSGWGRWRARWAASWSSRWARRAGVGMGASLAGQAGCLLVPCGKRRGPRSPSSPRRALGCDGGWRLDGVWGGARLGGPAGTTTVTGPPVAVAGAWPTRPGGTRSGPGGPSRELPERVARPSRRPRWAIG